MTSTSPFNRVSPRQLYNPPKGIVIRAGLIPAIQTKNGPQFLMGLYPDDVLTDMGGGCKTSCREKPIDCLVREIREETDDQTAELVNQLLLSAKQPIEVWRQTGANFRDLGYPFQQKQPGPVHRYYVILYIPNRYRQIGGSTNKKEVKEYRWSSLDELAELPAESFSLSIQDFMKFYLERH